MKIDRKKAIFLTLAVVTIMVVLIMFLAPKKKSDSSKDFMILNTDKSVYSTGETVLFSVSLLDQNGKVSCHGNLDLTITDPEKNKTELTKENGKITISTTCIEGGKSTNDPDYFASFTPQKAGEYKITLTNIDNQKSAKIQIKVENNREISVSRKGATRIKFFEEQRQPMIITISTKKDFKGQLVEQLPSSFTIAWRGQTSVEEKKGIQTITWRVDMKAGETKEFIYEYQVSKGSFGLFNLGKISLSEGDNKAAKKVVEEQNPWQIIVESNS